MTTMRLRVLLSAVAAAIVCVAAPALAQIYTPAQGTTSDSWEVGVNGGGARTVAIVDDAGVVEFRGPDGGLTQARAATPVGADDLVPKAYADGNVGGLSWPAPASGCLSYSGGSLSWVSCGGSGSSVTGTGLWYSDSGTLNAAAVTITGDLSPGSLVGNDLPIAVVNVNGASVPSAGSLTTGNVLQVSGSSALVYGPIDVGGGSNVVVGVLKTANGGTGVSSLTDHAFVIGNGSGAVSTIGPCASGVPILGAGSSADPTCSALNLAGGSSVVTNQLPLANLAPGESGQIPITNSGATAAAWVTPSGDLVVTADGVATVGGLLGVSLPSLASGCLASTGSAWEFTSCSGGSTPTGTGFVHVTSGSQDSAARAVDVSSADITGTMAVANGGSGAATFTAHALLAGEGTSAFAPIGPCEEGQPIVGADPGEDPVCNGIDLAGGSDIVYGVLPVSNGGTGASSLTAYAVLLGNGTSAVSHASPGTSGLPLRSTGASANPAFGTLDLSLGSTLFTGTLAASLQDAQTMAGDVTGTTGSNTVVSLTGSSGTVAVPASTFDFGSASTPTLEQDSTSGATGANFEIDPQASTNANGTPGGVSINLAAPTGTGAYAGLTLQQIGGTQAVIGSRNSLNEQALWLTVSSPSSDNYSILNDGATLQINGPTRIVLGTGGGQYHSISGSNFEIGSASPASGGAQNTLGIADTGTAPSSTISGGLGLNSISGVLSVNADGIEFPSFVSGPTISGAGIALLTTSGGTLTLDSSTIADSAIDIGVFTTGPITVGNSATSVAVDAPLSSRPEGDVSVVLTEAHQGTHGSQAGKYDRGLFGFGSIVSEGGAVQLLKVPTTTNKAGVLRATVTCRVTSGSGGDTVGAVAMDIGTVTFTNISGTTTLVGSEDYWESITNASNMATGMNVSAAVDGDGSSVDLSVGYISESVSGDCTATAEALQN